MGNTLKCMKNDAVVRSRRRKAFGSGRSQKNMLKEEELLHRQALAMAIQQHQLSQRFDGSLSRRIGSSRRRDLTSDPLSKQAVDIPESVKSTRFVLVHGEGFGAWCWYKVSSWLEEMGCRSVALDLSASGIDLSETAKISSMSAYCNPLLTFLGRLPENEKVILVGHSVGGACVSFAMEQFPDKIEKAVFVCAAMVSDGQRPFDVFSEQFGSAERFMEQKRFMVYGNGEHEPPTGFAFESQQMKGLYFNQSPNKDVSLAMACMRATPLGPIMEKMTLTRERYGACRRYYVETLDDVALPADAQEKMVRENPPERVFNIKGSDHCPFFSKAQSLNKILIEIAAIP